MNAKKAVLSGACALLAAFTSVLAAPTLDDGFSNPPAQASPWCYWYWVSDNISKHGITKDLEAMKRVGIGEALIGNIFLTNQPAGPIKVLSEEWWSLVEHAIREGGRIGVNIGLFNCPGWSQSGGPWIKLTEAMRFLVSSEKRVIGPQRFSGKLETPAEPFQDVALLAYPAPAQERDTLASRRPRVSLNPAGKNRSAKLLVDGDLETAAKLPASGRATLDIELEKPLTARSLELVPSTVPIGATCELQARNGAGEFDVVRKFDFDRTNMSIKVGPMPQGPVSISFPAITSDHFRLVFSKIKGRGPSTELAEVHLSGAARLESHIEKQLGKMHPTPLPEWDSYLWQSQPELESADLAVPAGKIINLSSKLAADGTLTWEVPAGEWIIQRTGMTPTGTRNAPASPEGQGIEVDKMNRELAKHHFDSFVGQLLERMPAADRKAFTRVVADSYEMGSQNWTDGMAEDFKKQYGYDPMSWLPVLTGRIVGSVTESERFLWDLRRMVADRIATEYVGGLREASNEHGLGLWLENYGHWGFPGEFLKYGSRSDRIGGEFWVTGNLGSVECRDASSCANTYGKRFVSAESFTGGPPFKNAPRAFKARGDWSFCEGINHVVLHVYIQQPDDAKVPGINAPWGTEFNRHNTWFEPGKAWVDYERRCCWMLQQGWRVADVAYFIGEDTPKMSGVRDPALPAGRDFDSINAEVIERDLTVKDGMLVLPHGVSYRVLVLPKQDTMRPALLTKIRDLVKAGATVMGPPPSRSPSLEDFPKADENVAALASEIWGGGDLAASGEHLLGAGRVIWGKSLEDVFAESNMPPDIEYRNAAKDSKFLFTHRRSDDAEIYFISNQTSNEQRVETAFRVGGMRPELWDAVSGERRILPDFREENSRTIIPLEFAPEQSWFVVFRKHLDGELVESAVNFPPLETISTLAGDWDVSFDPKWGGPAEIVFSELIDWSKNDNAGIRFYSGTAIYRKTFEVEDAAGDLFLDLGDVRDMATVRVNGKELATLWTAPWRVNLAGAVKVGSNSLEIEVVNPWNNRLVGDVGLPPKKRLTSLSLATVKQGSPLQAAGLLGPVTLQKESQGEAQ